MVYASLSLKTNYFLFNFFVICVGTVLNGCVHLIINVSHSYYIHSGGICGILFITSQVCAIVIIMPLISGEYTRQIFLSNRAWLSNQKQQLKE